MVFRKAHNAALFFLHVYNCNAETIVFPLRARKQCTGTSTAGRGSTVNNELRYKRRRRPAGTGQLKRAKMATLRTSVNLSSFKTLVSITCTYLFTHKIHYKSPERSIVLFILSQNAFFFHWTVKAIHSLQAN